MLAFASSRIRLEVCVSFLYVLMKSSTCINEFVEVVDHGLCELPIQEPGGRQIQ